MNMIDLHTHSTCSDGTLTPKELIEYAKKKGLSAIALTDHDTTEGIEAAKKHAKESGINFIPGIEISTDYDKTEIHIVGLFIDESLEFFVSWLKELKTKRDESHLIMIERLKSLGVSITMDDVRENSGGNVITRANFARAMVAKGYVNSLDEAFDRYIGTNKPAYVERKRPDYKTAIEYINRAGGVAVLAHPLIYGFGKKVLREVIYNLKEAGLKGIEAYYSTHDTADTKLILSIAKEYGLAPSGGSDFHGDNKPKLDLGTGYGRLFVPEEILKGLSPN